MDLVTGRNGGDWAGKLVGDGVLTWTLEDGRLDPSGTSVVSTVKVAAGRA